MNLLRGLTAEHEAQAFWEKQGYGHKNISELLGASNGIFCILQTTLPSSGLAVPQGPTPDTVSKNGVSNIVYRMGYSMMSFTGVIGRPSLGYTTAQERVLRTS